MLTFRWISQRFSFIHLFIYLFWSAWGFGKGPWNLGVTMYRWFGPSLWGPLSGRSLDGWSCWGSNVRNATGGRCRDSKLALHLIVQFFGDGENYGRKSLKLRYGGLTNIQENTGHNWFSQKDNSLPSVLYFQICHRGLNDRVLVSHYPRGVKGTLPKWGSV